MAFRAEKPSQNDRNDMAQVEVVDENDEVVGVGRATKRPGESFGVIEYVAVKKEVRKQGIGTLLVSALFGWIGSAGGNKANVEIVSEDGDQAGAEEFYRRQGFKVKPGKPGNPPIGSKDL